MPHRRIVTVLCFVMATVLALTTGQWPADARAHPAPPPTPQKRTKDGAAKVVERLAKLDKSWTSGTDLLVTGAGDENGFHLFVGAESSAYGMRSLATIRPFEADDDWLGDYCLTGDRRHVVVNLITRRAVNRPEMLAHGGLLYVVTVADGSVRAAGTGLAMNVASLRCGDAGNAAVVSYSAAESPTTAAYAVDTGKGALRKVAELRGKFLDPHVVGDSVVLRQGGSVVEARGGTSKVVFESKGRIEVARASGQSVEIVERDGKSARLRSVGRSGGAAMELGAVHDQRAQMLSPAAAPVRMIGTGRRSGRTAAAFKVGGYGTARVRDVSAEGKVVLLDLPRKDRGAKSSGLQIASESAEELPEGPRMALSWAGNGETLRVGMRLSPGPLSTIKQPAAPPKGMQTLANSTVPKCAVPRNAPNRMAYNSTAKQSSWATEMASRNNLKGANARPANYRKSGLPAYSPSSDFTIPALAPSNGSVPPVVMNAVMAQESAYRHATRRSLPGSGGNPLIGDYYGAKGTLDKIDYDNADCGYGISQVTTGMAAADGGITPNGKAKIAIDYAENIQAGMQILAGKWNQLYGLNIRMNDSDPNKVENWYFALWAYNSGLQPNAANGNTTGCSPSPSCTDRVGGWGLGWTNNPNNDSYRVGRNVFLRDTYADAARPWEWAYQERVLGFAETPIKDYKGQPAYFKAHSNDGGTAIHYPPNERLCTADNHCNGGTEKRCEYTTGDLAFHCWWHWPITIDSCATFCATSDWQFAAGDPEPAGENPFPPACETGLPLNSVIIDELPDPGINIFCANPNWTQRGTFEMTFGKDGAGVPLSAINHHQVATGMGGHTWFSGNALASDPAHQAIGTWSISGLPTGLYLVKAHIPASGASATSATYRITTSNGSVQTRTINQHEHFNHWKSLGVHSMGTNAKVELNNVTRDDTQDDVATVAWDALALVPMAGTAHSNSIDQVAYFDEDQDLDAAPSASWLIGPFASRAKLHTFGTTMTDGVLSKPVCPGATRNAGCIGPNISAAFRGWRTQIDEAGTDPVNHPRGKSMPVWLGAANPVNDRPTGDTIPSRFLTSDSAYKIRLQATVWYMTDANGTKIVPGSEDVTYQHRTGNTSMGDFVRKIFTAVQQDYGVRPPDLQYDMADANEHNHRITHVNANVSGQYNGRAFRFGGRKPQITQVDGHECLVVGAIGGGMIGDRTMSASDYVVGEVNRWRTEIAQRTDLDLPYNLTVFANELYKWFFDPSLLNGPAPHSKAAPIWQELNFASCADGKVRKINAVQPIADYSWMPNQYLYLNGQAIDQNGNRANSANPLSRGDYKNFTTLLEPSAYGKCVAFQKNPHRGNPWDINELSAVGTNPGEVRFCSDGTVPDGDF